MATEYYRRKLTLRELIPAIGAGVGAGVAVAYLAQIMLRKTPLASGPAHATGAGTGAPSITRGR